MSDIFEFDVGDDDFIIPALAEHLRHLGMLGIGNDFAAADELMLISGGPIRSHGSRSLLIGPPAMRFRAVQPEADRFELIRPDQDPLSGRIELGPPAPALEWSIESWEHQEWKRISTRAGRDLANSMAALEDLIPNHENRPGSLCGAFAYDLVQWTQRWALLNRPQSGALLGLLYPVDRWILHDRVSGRLTLGGADGDRWVKIVEQVLRDEDLSTLELSEPLDDPPACEDEWSNCTDEEHSDAVRRVQRSISQGQLYQLNFGRKWHGSLAEQPWEVQVRLLRTNPASWSSYLSAPDLGFALCSASPEMLVDGQGGRLCTAPIKGTKPRGRDAEEDSMMKRELLECPKERAEHLMLVDLERNDMTMFCEPGSVSRTSFCIETYADVHHLVSEVEGTLRNDKNIWDALQSMFPGGSISGCPKTVTIAAIDQLEGESRSFWTGSMGILDYETRSLSLNIMIRTLEANKNGSAWNGTVQAGGGLVIGSEPSTEVEEAKWKAAALRRSAGWISRQGENSTELSDLSVEMIETEVGQAGEPDRIGDILRWPDIPAASSRTVAFIDNLDSFSWNIANSLALEGANVVMVPGRMQSSPGLDEMLEIIQPTHVVIGPGPGVPENSPLSMQAARCALKGEMPPVLGVCLGHQALGVSCGWPLVENRSGAVHGEPCELEPAGEGLCDATGPMTRYHSLVLDPSADQMANSELDVTQWDAGGLGLIMALRHKRHPVHAVQYHPESVESEGGQSIFRAFLQL